GRATSDVGVMRSFAFAIPFFGLAMLGARMAPEGTRALLLERGWPPYVTVMLTCFALSILVLKAFGLRRQRSAFGLVLPGEDARIGTAQAQRSVDHLESLRDPRTRTFLVARVVRVLK